MLKIIGGGRAGGGAVVKATRNGDGSITLVGTGSQFAYKLAGDAVVLVTGHGASTYDIPSSTWTDEVEAAGNTPETLAPGSAPTVPDAITDLAATHGNAQVVLTWTPPDDGGSAFTGYTVERSLDGSTGWTEIATPGAAATGATDTGLTNGTEYFYRVKAINGEGAAATWSNVDSATPATVPAQVTTLAAIAGDTEIDLSWTAPSNGGSALTGYTLQRKVGAGSFANLATPAAGATSYNDTGLTNGTLYTYRIVAENAEGAAASWSNEASGTPDVSSDYTINEDPDIAADINIVQTNLGGGSWKFDVEDAWAGDAELSWDGKTVTTTETVIDEEKPVVIDPPTLISDGAGGEKRVRLALSFAKDPRVPEATIEVLRNGTAIPGEPSVVGARHAEYELVPATDLGRQIDMRFNIASAAGAAPASPYLVTLQAGYDEMGLAFNDTTYFQRWQSNTSITYALAFWSFEAVSGSNDMIMGRNSRDRVLANLAGSTIPVIGNRSVTYAGNTARQHILMSLHGAASGSLTVRAARWYNGTLTNNGTISTTGEVLFGGSAGNFGFNTTLQSGATWTLYRAALWDLTAYQAGGGTLFDVTDPACQDLFWADSILRDPALSHAHYGDADGGAGGLLYDLYGGDLAFINSGNGKHYGVAGWDGTSGTWSAKGSDIAEAA